MEDQSGPIETYHIIEPKEEMVDSDTVEVTVVKEEVTESGNEEDVTFVSHDLPAASLRPIKTETTLSKEIAQMQRQIQAADTESSSFILNTPSSGPIAVSVKVESIDEPSCSTASTSEPGLTPGTQRAQKMHSCNVCGKKWKRKSVLAAHMKVHSAEKLFSCDICQAKFKHRHNLPAHIRTHTGERPFKCEFCPATFTTKGVLTAHVRMHTGEKPFSCGTCQAKFTTKHCLNIHIKAHKGDKPHACELCQAAFVQKSDLTAHMLVHSGEKPYSCDLCHAKFARKHIFIAHMVYVNCKKNLQSSSKTVASKKVLAPRGK